MDDRVVLAVWCVGGNQLGIEVFGHLGAYRRDLLATMSMFASLRLGSSLGLASQAPRASLHSRARRVTEPSPARIGGSRDRWIYRVTGSGFLHHMVRNLVGTFVELGSHRIPPDAIPTILAARNRSAAGPTAPARGLFLVEVFYPQAEVEP